MSCIQKRAYAKINLHLDVISRMPDGYHEVNTVMQSVSLFDDVSIEMSEGCGIELRCNKEGVPLDSKNLAWRAAELVLSKCNVSKRLLITIDKRIPMAGGLGGGSADAAAVLCGLDRLLGDPIEWSELLRLGGLLGADVPFCMAGGSAYADGKGDVLHPFPALSDCYIVISQGGEGASTPWAYGELDKRYNNFTQGCYVPRSVCSLRAALEGRELDAVCANLYNIFESVVLGQRPVAAQIKKTLLSCGAVGAMMSGSGTSVFGIFKSEKSASLAVAAIEHLGYSAYLCRPV